MIRVFDKFGNAERVPHLDIPTRTLYLLAADSTPQSARDEAIERAESGGNLTLKETKELVEAHREIEAHQSRIKDLEASLDEMSQKLPTEDVLAEIDRLKSELEAERAKPPEVVKETVPPDDYDALKAEKARLEQEKAIQRLNEDLEEIKSEVDRIGRLRDNESACLKAHDDIRRMLVDISIIMRDLFEDHELTDAMVPKFKKLAHDFQQGAAFFRDLVDENAVMERP